VQVAIIETGRTVPPLKGEVTNTPVKSSGLISELAVSVTLAGDTGVTADAIGNSESGKASAAKARTTFLIVLPLTKPLVKTYGPLVLVQRPQSSPRNSQPKLKLTRR